MQLYHCISSCCCSIALLEAKEAEAEGTKPRIIIEDETKDRKKEEKAHALSKDERLVLRGQLQDVDTWTWKLKLFPGRSFHKDKVMFTKDVEGLVATHH